MATIEITQQNWLLPSRATVSSSWTSGQIGAVPASSSPPSEAASEKHTDIVFGKVDTEDQGQLAQAAGITSIPTIMGFRGGILVYQQAGTLREDQLEDS